MSTRPNPRDTLSANVKQLMTLRGWTQMDLAQYANIAQKTVSNILNARSDIQLDILDKIARAFGLNLWHLIMPNLPDDLAQSTKLDRLLNHYLNASPEGREMLDRLAAYTDREEPVAPPPPKPPTELVC